MNKTQFSLESELPTVSEASTATHCLGSLDLRLADCMDVMATFPDKYFDLAIVDPPYGLGDKWQGGDSWVLSSGGDMSWDFATPTHDYFKELGRVSQKRIVWGANHFGNMPPSSCWLIWDKMTKFSSAEFEMAWTNFDSPAKAFRMSRVEAYAVGKIHPTQKPTKLYDWIFANYAKPGMRVLDTHMGSGSIAIAAHYAGIHLTACEIDPDYFAAAKARIARETSQAELFNIHNS